MKNYLLMTIVIIIVVFISCQKKVDSNLDEQALQDWFDKYVTNNKSGLYENFVTFWTDDVIWMPPNSSIVKGKDSVMLYVKPSFDALKDYTFDQKIITEEIKTVQDYGFARVRAYMQYIPKKAGLDTIQVEDKGLFLFRKINNNWYCSHCIWNYNSNSN